MFDMPTRVMLQAAPIVRLAVFLALVVCQGFSLRAQELEPSRPNIIVMMADDMGWGSLDAPGFSVRVGLNPDDSEVRYQGTTLWETPNLAAMASDGLNFSRMYSQSPVCSPTRASVMTGRHPERMGIPFANNGRMENREITIAEYAQALGYTTGLFGKWHLGSMTREVNDSNRGGPGSFGIYSFPTSSGFDELYATESKTNTYNPLQLNPTTRYWTDPGVSVPFTVGNVANPEILGDDSAIVARETMSFMDQAVSDGEPFLSVVWFHTPHKPVTSPTAGTNTIGAYITAMEDLDAAVGQIRDRVQELGIADNTILMFTSDNGPEDDQDWNGSVPLRANKRELFEGGLRVPGLIEWAGKIAPGETHTPMVTTDILPTLLDIWGVAPADDRPLDGQSMVTTIFDDRQAEREKTLVFRSTNGHRSALGFNGRYKLISTNNGGNWELYDIVYDFDENDPIATDGNIDEQPDEIQQVYNELLNELQDRFVSMDISLSGNITGDFETRISSVNGVTLRTEPPEFLGLGARPSNTPELFLERQYATLRESVTMDSDGSPGLHDFNGAAILPAGKVVHSYLVHHDPANNSNTVAFDITFEDDIVGVIGEGSLLRAAGGLSFGDPDFGSTNWGLNGADNWTISADRRTISFSSTVSTGVDQVRILTESSMQFVSLEETLLGDVNQDGVVNFLDIAPFIELLSTDGFSLEADVDGNGVVDFLDISPFITLLSGG